MSRLILNGWLFGPVVLGLGCSPSQRSEELVERNRQSTISQIANIKSGESRSLNDPAPSLIEEMTSDPACADNIDSLYFSDFGPDLSDPRYGGIRTLPKLKTVYFYCTANTDMFLSRIAGMESLEEIETELADVSNAGMEYVAECPNLKKLVLYGGSPSVGNPGLAKLREHRKLETLELINTSVSDDGLSVLATLPNLKSLVLFWEVIRGERITDASFKHLENLSQLETLELSGGWASEETVEKLRSQLPDCKIVTEGSH